jgi:hypothetical protein
LPIQSPNKAAGGKLSILVLVRTTEEIIDGLNAYDESCCARHDSPGYSNSSRAEAFLKNGVPESGAGTSDFRFKHHALEREF